MNQPLIGHDDVLRLQTATISAGLGTQRAGLLAGIPRPFVAGIPLGKTTAEQVLIDLDTLNTAGSLNDGTVPLIVWLSNAITLAGPRGEVITFELMRNQARAARGKDAAVPVATGLASLPLDIEGQWLASWRSVKNERRHDATLTIYRARGTTFDATMLVEYYRKGRQTIVAEILAGFIWDRTVSLKGVQRTFKVQGAAEDYVLDHFGLTLSDDGQTLDGRASLTNGDRAVTFRRQVFHPALG